MKKALLIGLNDYVDLPLTCCNNDAEEFANLIETNDDGSPNFDVKIVTGSLTRCLMIMPRLLYYISLVMDRTKIVVIYVQQILISKK